MKKNTTLFHHTHGLWFITKHRMILLGLITLGVFVYIIKAFAAVTVTPATGGTEISPTTASDGASPVYTLLSGIVITEGANNDLLANQSGTRLILTPPANWEFKPGSGTITKSAGNDITAISLSVLSTGVIVTLSTDTPENNINTITITGLQVRAITGSLAPSTGNILRVCSNSGNAIMAGITCDSTNFGTLSMSTPSADLRVTKSVNTGIVYSGTTVVYTIQYNNSGITSTTGSIIDTLPNGFTYQSSSPSGTLSGNTLTFTGLTFNINTTGTIVITGVGNSTITSGLTMTNSATISGNITDPSSANNTATATSTGATIVITPTADLSINKVSNNTGFLSAGQLITYTITYVNNGPNTATGVIIEDSLSGINFVSSSPTLTLSGGKYYLTGINLASGANGTITITGSAISGYAHGTTLSNSVSISSSTADNTPGNNSSSVSNTYYAYTDLSISKSVNNGTAYSGTTIVYTLNYTNNGPDTAYNVIVSDILPSTITYISSNPTLVLSGSTYVMTGLTLPVGATGSITITGIGNSTITSGVTITNTGTISTTTNEANTANNTSTVTSVGASTTPTADLTITKTANQTGSVTAGQLITYTITYTNNGPNSATGVIITDIVSGITFVSSNPTLVLSGSQYVLTGLDLPNGSGGTIIITGSATTGSANGDVLSNTATISSQTADGNVGNNSSSATVIYSAVADLGITKSSNTTGNIANGTPVTYTLNYYNNSPDTAYSVMIADILPSTVDFVGSTPTLVLSGSQYVLTGLTLSAGATGTITINAIGNSSISSGSTITNTGTISSTTTDNNTANNTATTANAGISIIAELSISKSVNTGYTIVGSTLTYTITYQNNGPNTATGLIIEDILSSGLTYQSSTPTLTLSGANYYLTGINLPSGSTGSITITATIDAGLSSGTVVINTANISSTIGDSNTGNNTSSANTTVYVPTANLSINKTVNYTSVTTGQTITYTITYQNNGPYTATSVVLNDIFPTSADFVSSNPAYSSSGGNTYTWNLGNLANGSGGTITITATVSGALNSGDIITNTGNISSSTVDSNNANNVSVINSVVSNTPSTDLSISKSANISTVNTGTLVTYTITYQNLSATTSTGVMITDILPTGITFLSSSPSPSAGTGNTYTWNIGTLNGNTSGTIIITGIVNSAFSSGTQLINTGSITGSVADTNNGNNTATATVTYIPQSDLGVTKTANSTTLNHNGGNILYTINYVNNGNDNSSTVTVTDILPANLQFVSANPSPTSSSGNTYTWTFNNVGSGNTGVIYLTATVLCSVSSGTSIINTTSINGTNTDNNTANNSSSHTGTVIGTGCPLVVSYSGAIVTSGNIILTGYMITTGNSGNNITSGTTTTPIQFVSGSTTVTLASGTQIYTASGNQFPIQELNIYYVESTSTGVRISFGITGHNIYFTMPIKIEISHPGPGPVPVFVSHYPTYNVFGTVGLTTNPNQLCSNGLPTINISNNASWTPNIATIYSCQASDFKANISTTTPTPTTTTTTTTNNGGGGGIGLIPDECGGTKKANGTDENDRSASYYDGICSPGETPKNTITLSTSCTFIPSTQTMTFGRYIPIPSTEQRSAFNFMVQNKLTKFTNNDDFLQKDGTNSRLSYEDYIVFMQRLATSLCIDPNSVILSPRPTNNIITKENFVKDIVNLIMTKFGLTLPKTISAERFANLTKIATTINSLPTTRYQATLMFYRANLIIKALEQYMSKR